MGHGCWGLGLGHGVGSGGPHAGPIANGRAGHGGKGGESRGRACWLGARAAARAHRWQARELEQLHARRASVILCETQRCGPVLRVADVGGRATLEKVSEDGRVPVVSGHHERREHPWGTVAAVDVGTMVE